MNSTVIMDEPNQIDFRHARRGTTMKFTFSPESRPLDGYTIKRAIHRGGFGEVYYALTDAGREVALKLLQNNAEIELRGVQQCLNLSHPNLVTIFDVRQDGEGDFWIIMEYVSGETLDAVLRRYPRGMPVEQVRKWMTGIVAGVSFLHSRAIVHRDLKPGNVFGDGQHVKVGDIGLSKFITQSRRSAQTQSVGTVYYMAPEVAKGRYGKEVDIYALGVMLYEMLTGQVPFDGESTGEILMKHLSEPPDLSLLPPRLRGVVGRALAKDPARRYSSLQEFEDAFTRAILGKDNPPVEVPPVEVPDEAFDRQPKSRAEPARGIGSHHWHDRSEQRKRHRTQSFLISCAIVILGLFALRLLAGDGRMIGTVFVVSAVGVLVYYRRLLPQWWKQAGEVVAQTFRNITGGEPAPREHAPPVPPPVVSPPPLLSRPRPFPRSRSAAAPPHSVNRWLARCQPRPARQELALWLAGSCLAVPVTFVLVAGLAFLEPSLFANVAGLPKLDPGALGLFALTAVVSVWSALLIPVVSRLCGDLSGRHSRFAGLLLGLGVGVTAGALDSYLLVSQVTKSADLQAAIVTIGERPLLTGEAGPTWLGYVVFFVALFVVRNWTGMSDPWRRRRFSVWSVVVTVFLAWMITLVFAFPHEWAMAWGAIVSCVVQISSPWRVPIVADRPPRAFRV